MNSKELQPVAVMGQPRWPPVKQCSSRIKKKNLVFRGERSEILHAFRLVRLPRNRELVAGIGPSINHCISWIRQSHNPPPKPGWGVVPELQVETEIGNYDRQIFVMHGLDNAGEWTNLLVWHHPVAG